MANKDKAKELLDSLDNGIITTNQINDSGIYRGVLKELVDDGIIYRVDRGIYAKNDILEDELFIKQQKYKRGIYSHDTALYLLGYSDRAPAKYTMTFPKGYNTPSTKQENINIIRVVPENYSLGIIEIESFGGSIIKTYDLERSLCDILRGKGSDIQIINAAFKKYATSKNKDIHKLMMYADKLRVKSKVLRYMEVLL